MATFDPTLHVAHVNAPDLVPGIPDLALMGLAISTVGAAGAYWTWRSRT